MQNGKRDILKTWKKDYRMYNIKGLQQLLSVV